MDQPLELEAHLAAVRRAIRQLQEQVRPLEGQPPPAVLSLRGELEAAFDGLVDACRGLVAGDGGQALLQSEERYRRLLASVTDYVYEVKVESGRPVATAHGPGSIAVTGYSAEDFAVAPLLWLLMVHKDDRAAVEEQARRALAGERVPPLEHRIWHKDDSLRWLRNTPMPRFDASGQLVGYDGLVTDITERCLAQEALRDSEEKYRTLFRAATDAIFVETLDGRVLECNSRACDMLGYSEDELLQLTVADLVPPAVRATLPEVTRQHETGGSIYIEAENQRKNGEVFPCEVSTQVTVIGGEPRVIVSVRDITERREAEAERQRAREAETRAAAAEAAKQMLEAEVARRQRVEAALLESEAKFRTLAEQSPNMILINRGGRIVYANEACEGTLGYTCHELCDPAFDRLSLFAPGHVAQAQTNFTRHLDGEEVPPREYALLAKDGGRVEVILATRLVDYEGERAILGLATDITERKREEERLRELQRQITDLPAEEQRRIGHELHDNLGQQLTGITMLAKSLCQKLRSRAAPEADDAEQVFALVRETHAQLRSLSRGLMPVEVDAQGLMSALAQLAEANDRLPGVRCRFICRTPVGVEDTTVATHLYRVAQEAVTNALLHGKPEQVTISLGELDDRTVLEVRDDGCGFTCDPRESSGMGLEIMHYRATAIGAELHVKPAAGGGTVVRCSLPRGAA